MEKKGERRKTKKLSRLLSNGLCVTVGASRRMRCATTDVLVCISFQMCRFQISCVEKEQKYVAVILKATYFRLCLCFHVKASL